MKAYNYEIGSYGEGLAKKYLSDSGYHIICENFSSRLGEIDVIARDGDYICFIEVKSRYSNKFGMPRESVTSKKQKKIRQTAEYYILLNNISSMKFRFDVIEIYFKDNSYSINLIKNAFC